MRLASPTLARAAREYRWLLDRDYAASAALKLVGDRHQMTKDERMILFRGVARSSASEARARAIAAPESLREGLEFLVDGYNQALTIYHYLAGRPLFIGTDGLTRDAGGAHGRIADQARFARSVELLASHLVRSSPLRVAIYLDSPVPGSAGHAALFRRLFAQNDLVTRVELERSADAPLKAAITDAGARADRGPLVASSDSAIADAAVTAVTAAALRDGSGARLYDAARWAIETAFGAADLLDLGLLAASAKNDL